MSVFCAFAKFEDVPGLLCAPIKALSESEQARWAGFGSERRRQAFLAGRILARWVLARRLGLLANAALSLKVDIDAQGRSTFPDCPRFYLSISHSGNGVACVLADAAVGVDLEDQGKERDFLALAEQIHSKDQRQHLAECSAQARAEWFYRWWTLKEAWLKCQGLGLDPARMRRLVFEPVEVCGASSSVLLQGGQQCWALAIEGGTQNMSDLVFFSLSPGIERRKALSFHATELAGPSSPN